MSFAGQFQREFQRLGGTKPSPPDPPASVCHTPGEQLRRVLLVAPFAPRGGGMGRMMAYLAQSAPPGMQFDMVESRGGGGALASPAFVLRAARRILVAALRQPGAIVHLNVAEGSSVARKGALLLFARLLGLPCVLHLHAAEIIPFHDRLPRSLRALMGLVFRQATVCIVLGEPWRQFLWHDLRVDPGRIELLRNGVPRAVIRRFAPPPKEFSFVFLGNLLPRKGLPDLLHALADRRLSQLAWRLTVIGGGDTGKLHCLAVTLGISGRVNFAGWLDRDAASHLLAQAGALVLPSYHEALPLVLLEAAALGVPIITTDVGAIGEVFTDEQTALLLRPGNRRAMASALHRVATETGLAARLGGQARLLYEQGYTLDCFTAGLMAIYARHCGTGPARRAA